MTSDSKPGSVSSAVKAAAKAEAPKATVKLPPATPKAPSRAKATAPKAAAKAKREYTGETVWLWVQKAGLDILREEKFKNLSSENLDDLFRVFTDKPNAYGTDSQGRFYRRRQRGGSVVNPSISLLKAIDTLADKLLKTDRAKSDRDYRNALVGLRKSTDKLRADAVKYGTKLPTR